VWQIPDAVDTVVCAPDDEWKYHPKHVEQFPDINKLCDVATCWVYEYIGILLGAHPVLHISRIKVKLYMFRRVPLSIIKRFSLYTHQWCMSCRFADSLRVGSEWNIMILLASRVWRIPLLCVLWKTSDDRQRNSPKHAEFHSNNKFEKLVHLVGFIIRNLTRCTVIWMSNMIIYFYLCIEKVCSF
jgi:hypothetical protein